MTRLAYTPLAQKLSMEENRSDDDVDDDDDTRKSQKNDDDDDDEEVSSQLHRHLPTSKHRQAPTSQQRARRLLNGADPWGQKGSPCCGGLKAKDGRRGLIRKCLTRGLHLCLSAIVILILITHRKSPLRTALMQGPDHTNLHPLAFPTSILYLCLFFSAISLYFITCLRDPGFVSLERFKKGYKFLDGDVASSEPWLGHRLPHNSSKPLLRECGFCGLSQPLRARHCEDCGRCVRRFDHHCPWLETCIGQGNHAVFWWFLLVQLLVLVGSLFFTYQCFSSYLGTGAPVRVWVAENGSLFINYLILIPSSFMVTGLLCFHSYLAGINSTTWEMTSRHRITYLAETEEDFEPFDAGICLNLVQFCCVMSWASSGSSAYRWETQYLKAAKRYDEETMLEMDSI